MGQLPVTGPVVRSRAVNDHGGAPAATARPSIILKLAALCALAALAAAILGPVGTRLGILGAAVGYGIFLGAAWLALAAALLALAAAWRTGRLWRAIGVMVLAAVAAAVPVRTWLAARGAPPIHDVTTDLDQSAASTWRWPSCAPAGGEAVAYAVAARSSASSAASTPICGRS